MTSSPLLRLFPQAALALLAAALILLVAPARSMDISLVRNNVLNGQLQDFWPTLALFTPNSSDVFSLIVSLGPTAGGQLQNWAVDAPRPQSAYDLQHSQPRHADLVGGDLAVVFDAEPDLLVVYPGLGEPLPAFPLHKGSDPKFRPGHIALTPQSPTRTRRVLVWEWHKPDGGDGFGIKNLERVLSVYDYSDTSITQRSAISSFEYREKNTLRLGHEPAGAFHPSNESQYFASEGGPSILLFGISTDGELAVEKRQDVFDKVRRPVRSMAMSRDGRFIAASHGERASVYETETLQVRHATIDYDGSHLSEIGATTVLCWSPTNDYLVVGRSFINTTVIKYSQESDQFEDIDVELPGTGWDTDICAFAATENVFVLDSIRNYVRNPEYSSINISTYRISDGRRPDETNEKDSNSQDDIIPRERSAACFPASATVTLSDQRSIRLENLGVGDEVIVGYSGDQILTDTVFAFSHRDASDRLHPFVSLQHASGTLHLSADHLIYVKQFKDSASPSLVPAYQVNVGNFLISSQDGSLSPVTRIGRAYLRGLYNPHTLGDRLSVDGILVSTYTNSLDQSAAKALLWPFRKMYSLLGYNLLHGLLDDQSSPLEPLRYLLGVAMES